MINRTATACAIVLAGALVTAHDAAAQTAAASDAMAAFFKQTCLDTLPDTGRVSAMARERHWKVVSKNAESGEWTVKKDGNTYDVVTTYTKTPERTEVSCQVKAGGVNQDEIVEGLKSRVTESPSTTGTLTPAGWNNYYNLKLGGFNIAVDMRTIAGAGGPEVVISGHGIK